MNTLSEEELMAFRISKLINSFKTKEEAKTAFDEMGKYAARINLTLQCQMNPELAAAVKEARNGISEVFDALGAMLGKKPEKLPFSLFKLNEEHISILESFGYDVSREGETLFISEIIG